MSELDLPQITFARYLELLRRRRWQVIPVTLVGLLAGTIAAFLIPRYYVAQTSFVFQGGATLFPDAEDPMYAAATDARVEIPSLVGPLLVDKIQVEYRGEDNRIRTGRLDWPEAGHEDPEQVRAFVEDVKARILVVPVHDAMRAPNKVNLTVFYRDTDGVRARDLANFLVGAWKQETRKRLEAQAAQELDDLNRRVREASEAKRAAETELRNHMMQHGLTELSGTGNERGPTPRHPLALEKSELAREVGRLEQQQARLEQQVDALKLMLANGTIPAKIRQAEVDAVDPDVEERYQELVEQHRIAQRRLEGMAESNPQRRSAEALLEELTRLVEEVRAKRAAAQAIEIDNPAYQAKLEQIVQWESELAGVQKAREVVEQQLADVEGRLAGMPEIISTKLRLERTVERRDEELAEVSGLQRDANRRFNMLRTRQAVRVISPAQTPPRPTDPNILLVALTGCLIGLATAIGLILLLDFLQSAFKSVDDVERALPVPVLGALAHLETYEERTRTVAHRRRVSLAAGVFLFLSLSVITIYFVDKTRLPTPVADVLDVILGVPAASEPAEPK